jgi:hypothetical protein
MLVLKPTSTANIVHLASVIVHFLIEMATNTAFAATPFYHYTFFTPNISENDLPGEPQGEGELLTQASENTGVRLSYRCTCGCIL